MITFIVIATLSCNNPREVFHSKYYFKDERDAIALVRILTEHPEPDLARKCLWSNVSYYKELRK